MRYLRLALAVGGLVALSTGCDRRAPQEDPVVAVDPSQAPPREPVELVILLDVSGSLEPAEVQGEAATVFRYLSDGGRVPPGSHFMVFIADQDVERNLVASGKVGGDLSIHSATAGQGSVKVAGEELVNAQQLLKQRLLHYVQSRRDGRMRQTCLIRALASVSDYILRATGPKRVLLISDMEENCAGTNPRRASRRQTVIERRLAASLERYPLKGLAGVEVEAAFPKDSRAARIVDLKEPWTAVLVAAGVVAPKFGTIDTLLTQP